MFISKFLDKSVVHSAYEEALQRHEFRQLQAHINEVLSPDHDDGEHEAASAALERLANEYQSWIDYHQQLEE